jgi:hypothetical protein
MPENRHQNTSITAGRLAAPPTGVYAAKRAAPDPAVPDNVQEYRFVWV